MSPVIMMGQMSDTQILELVDSIIGLLGNQRTNDIITVRQKNHAQVYVNDSPHFNFI